MRSVEGISGLQAGEEVNDPNPPTSPAPSARGAPLVLNTTPPRPTSVNTTPSRSPSPALAIGDTVRMSTSWLRSTFTYSGSAPQARGIVVGLTGAPDRGQVARVRWDRPCFGDSLESSVLVANLQRRTDRGWEPRDLP